MIVASDGGQVRLRTAGEVQARCVEALGLDPRVLDLESPEALGALVRRTASLIAPCTARTLRTRVAQALGGLVDEGVEGDGELRAVIDEMVEALTSYGDLLELPTDDPLDGGTERVLYLAPPTFVNVEGVLFLLGGALDGIDAVPSGLRGQVEARSHTRRIGLGDVEELTKLLCAVGWVELRPELWLPAPRSLDPRRRIAEADEELMRHASVGDVPGLTVLNPATPPTYYPGRWVEPKRKTGCFVARREQRFGARLWSYVRLSDGVVTHLIDLPLRQEKDVRPCDAAWQLQMAIDHVAGRPQRYRLRRSPPSGSAIVDFFSPVPAWARRRWDTLGEEVARSGSLFAYRFPTDVMTNVRRTLENDLWLTERE